MKQASLEDSSFIYVPPSPSLTSGREVTGVFVVGRCVGGKGRGGHATSSGTIHVCGTVSHILTSGGGIGGIARNVTITYWECMHVKQLTIWVQGSIAPEESLYSPALP